VSIFVVSENKLTQKKLWMDLDNVFRVYRIWDKHNVYILGPAPARKGLGDIFLTLPLCTARDIELTNFAQARLGDSWLERVHRPLHEATHKQTGSPGCLWVGCVVVVEDRRSTLESCMGMGIAGKPREHRGNGDKTGGNTAGMGTVNVTNVTTAFVQ